MSSTLKWVERALWAAGIVLGVWCAMILLQARFFEHLPVPDRPISQSVSHLPGDPGSNLPAGAAADAHSVARGTWLARLAAPSIKLTATVLEGSDDATLARAAGHIEDTPLPGQPGNIGIAGHRDTTFRPVRNLKVGDTLTLTTATTVQTYRVAWTKIVDPDDVEVLDPTSAPALTLVTCYPFEYIGHAPRRFIVRADLISEGPRTTE